MYKLRDISIADNLLVIKFSSEKTLNSLKAEIRLKDMTRYAVSAYSQWFETEVTSDNDSHELTLDTAIFAEKFELKDLTKQIVWIYINDGDSFQEIRLDQAAKKKVKAYSPIPFCDLAQLNFMSKSNNTLALTLNKVDSRCELKGISLDNDKLIFDLLPVKLESSSIVQNVYLRKRAFKDTQIYSQSIPLEKYGENKYFLNINELNNIHYDTVNNLDFNLELSQKNVTTENPVIAKTDLKLPNLIFGEAYKTKLYITAKKSLSLRVEKQFHSIEMKRIEAIDDVIDIDLDLNSFNGMVVSGLKFGLFRENKLFNDNELTLFKDINPKFIGANLNLKLDLKDIFQGIQTNYEQVYSLVMYSSNDGSNTYYNLVSPEKMQFGVKMEGSLVSIVVEKEAKFIIKPNQQSPARISILGSCYSRAAFNSSNSFFNPDYKNNFSIVYSHFWISLISATSQPIPFDRSLYHDVPDKVITNVSKEYEKTTFDDLREINTDYIVMDFFVDAVHGCRKLPDGRFLGQNGDLHKSNYYKTKFLKETSQFDYRNPEFWDAWTKSCDEFIERISSIIDLNKIILNWGSLSDSYLNENHELSSFSKEKLFNKTEINYINHIWEKMNNYFISKVPAAKVIDLNRYNYHASLDYPYGGSGPHHYERNYYRSFLGELAKVILMDKY